MGIARKVVARRGTVGLDIVDSDIDNIRSHSLEFLVGKIVVSNHSHMTEFRVGKAGIVLVRIGKDTVVAERIPGNLDWCN